MFDGDHHAAASTGRWDFFVSYTQADRPWAEWIAWQLEADGFRVHLQAWDMVAGTNWTHAMQDAIRDSARTLAVLSAAYLDSAFGTQEWQAAVAADPDSARRRLIPVRVEDCDRPGLLGQVVSFDLFGMAENRARGELLARVREAIAGRAKPTHEPLFPGLALPRPGTASPAFPGTESDPGTPARDRLVEFHALLVGISSYEDERLPALPWLSGVLDSVAEHLEALGYRAEIHDRSRSGASAVKAAVHSFLRSAAPGSTLLLLLAGNAVHRAARGADAARDFLAPADATVEYQPFWDLCVPVDWSGPLAHTAAARVLVLVDGVTEYEESVRSAVTDQGWGAGRIEPAPGVDVAYIYRGEGTGGAGGDAPDPATRPSLTQALIDVLASRPLPTTLAELHMALEGVISRGRSHAEADGASDRQSGVVSQPTVLGRPPACRDSRDGERRDRCCPLRLLPPCDPLAFHPFPRRVDEGTVDAPPHAWRATAEQHRAWERTADSPATSALRDATGDLVDRLGRAYDAAAAVLADDPWHDPDFARRMVRRVEFLIGKLPAGPEELSAAEAALLVAGPYLHQTVWAVLVARAKVAHPGSTDGLTDRAERADFDAFTTGHPRLVRRIERAGLTGDQASAASVTWWLTHKWTESHVTARWAEVLRGLVSGLRAEGSQESLAAEVFRTDRLAEILTALRATATFLNQSGRTGALRDLVTVAPATSEEMPLRERLVGYLLAIGQKMALELAALPAVLVEHLGVADAVDLTDVRKALRRAEWQGRGRSTRALSVECRHPALQVALERHTAGLDALLAEAHRATAEIPALAGLPTHATADGVRAAETDGHPSYSHAGAQFRLAEDRVQELLMGEQLYENRALAVRELYQNALDACRYRRARTEYLARTTGRPSSWIGRIDFRQGFEPDGTPYIECRDNGIGMGYREISDVFAEAGTRTVDLPEVVEEMGRWAACDPPVTFYPNSRFGVGVLSYFMIADEIQVETCRLGPDGRPGDLLRVTIAGPGSLFRIEPLGPGRESGTTVRLYLSRDPKRPSISCVDILRRILWVAEFHTHAAEGAALEDWPAGQLAPSAPVGTSDPLSGLLRRETTQIVGAGRGIWWCNGVGAILADGLWVDEAVFGVVLDLTGPLVPELSVDRNKIRKLLDEPEVDATLTAALPVLRASDALEVTVDWLTTFSYSFPLVADALVDAMASDGESWAGIGEGQVPVARSGLLATDSALWLSNPTSRPTARSGTNTVYPFRVADTVFFSRMATWSKVDHDQPDEVDESGQLERVVPSDLEIVLLAGYPHDLATTTSKIEVYFLAGKLRTSPHATGRRIRRLGFQVPSLKACEATRVSELEKIALSQDLDGRRPLMAWRWREDNVQPGHVLAAASRLMVSPEEIRGRLAFLGIAVWPPVVGDVSAVPMDLVLQSAELDGRAPWLPPGRVSRAHVLRSALYTELSTAEVSDRLHRFGYRLPGGATLGNVTLGPGDAFIVSRDTTEALSASPVPTNYLRGLQAEERTSRNCNVDRLRELGFPVARTIRLPTDPSREFSKGFSLIDGEHSLWTTGRAVDRNHLLHLSAVTKLAYSTLISLLRTEGYTTAHIEPRAPKVTQIAETSSFILERVSQRGRCEIGDLVSISGIDGTPITEIVALLAETGVAFPEIGALEITHDDSVMLSSNLRGPADLLLMSSFVPTAQVHAAATRLRREPREIVSRLRHLGLAAADTAGLTATPVRPSDITLLSRDFDEQEVFLSDLPVPAAHVLRAAAQTGQNPSAAARRLGELGFSAEIVTSDELNADEERTVVDLLDVADDPLAKPGWAGLSRASILATAYRNGARRQPGDPAELAAWIGGLGAGLDTYARASFPDDLCFDDVDLLSWVLDGEPPWLASDEIGLGHVLAAAGITGRSPHDIADRLRTLGFTVANLPGQTRTTWTRSTSSCSASTWTGKRPA